MRFADQVPERPSLPTLVIHVLGCEPRLEAGPDRGPLLVGDRVPGGVAVATLDPHVLAKYTLEGEPEGLRGTPRGGVERVALPLNAAITKIVECMTHQQVDRLGGNRRPLQGHPEPDVTDLDDAELRRDTQVRGEAKGKRDGGISK